jgi:hypothetical protein
MTADGVRQVLEVQSLAGGGRGVHLHRFRHTFAHRWLADGGQERDLTMLASWRGDEMLSQYAASTAVERAHDAPPAGPRRLPLTGSATVGSRPPRLRRGPSRTQHVRSHEDAAPASTFGGVEDAVGVGLPLEPGPQPVPGWLGRRRPVGRARPPLGRCDTRDHGSAPGTTVT